MGRDLASDAEEFYNAQRSIGQVWGVVLPSWDELSWDEKIEQEKKFHEQLQRDMEADHPRS